MENSHIEHFKPQESHASAALDYSNLLASCIRETQPGMPLHCGHAKGNGFDVDLHISPMDFCCEEHFTYALEGDIFSTCKDDSRAAYMVELLQLNIPSLKSQRKAVLSIFDKDFLETISDAEIEKLKHHFGGVDNSGSASDFGHVVVRFLAQF